MPSQSVPKSTRAIEGSIIIAFLGFMAIAVGGLLKKDTIDPSSRNDLVIAGVVMMDAGAALACLIHFCARSQRSRNERAKVGVTELEPLTEAHNPIPSTAPQADKSYQYEVVNSETALATSTEDCQIPILDSPRKNLTK